MAKIDLNLSWLAIDALDPAPPGKRVTYHLKSARKNERVPPGFVLIVTDTGVKTYYIQRRIDGAQKRVFIERADRIDTDAALAEAWRITAEIARGEDPAKDRKARRARSQADQQTVAGYWKGYRRRHVERLTPGTRVLYDGLAKNYLLPKLGQAALAAVTRSMVRAFHDEVMQQAAKRRNASDGGRTANMAVNLLRSLYNDALDQELFTGPNPCERIRKAKEVHRDRFLSVQEITRLLEAVETDARERGDWTWSDFVKLALFTGARRGNLLAMRWEDLDIQERVWRIPAATTKTKITYLVALVPGALDILERRRQEAGLRAEARRLAPGATEDDCRVEPFVFPGRGGSGHLREPKGAWKRICALAQLEDFRVHDLRHTHASLLASKGVSLTMIGAQLGHRSTTTTSRYAHLSRQPVQLAIEAAFKTLDSDTDPDEVTP